MKKTIEILFVVSVILIGLGLLFGRLVEDNVQGRVRDTLKRISLWLIRIGFVLYLIVVLVLNKIFLGGV